MNRKVSGPVESPLARPWPASAEELKARQRELGEAAPPGWRPAADPLAVAGCFVCFARGSSGPGKQGELGWAGAALLCERRLLKTATVAGGAGGAYEPGLLALREGPLLEGAVRALGRLPELLLVNATGRDHPRRAGLALHLGAELGIPTVGVTHRPLVAAGPWPDDRRGAATPLVLEAEPVGYWLRTRRGVRPLAVHAAWRTDPETAVELVLACSRARTPEPLRQARRVARTARAI
jgi:deoxyribonuclease V